MNKQSLLHNIAQSAYDIGFGGKKHFITYDVHRILPRFISVATLVIGILQLSSFYKSTNAISQEWISIILIVIGVISLVLDLLGDRKEEYEIAGKKLIGYFNELRRMYFEIDSLNDSADFSIYEIRLNDICQNVNNISISKQAIATHIITHIGFFNVMQSNWVVTELKLTWRDKFPIYHWESILTFIIISAILIKVILYLI